MPRLIMLDNTELEVDYNKAAKIHQIMLGNMELDAEDPQYEQQVAFLDKVVAVEFDDKSKRDPRFWEQPNWWKSKKDID